jgi:hypothetical protein
MDPWRDRAGERHGAERQNGRFKRGSVPDNARPRDTAEGPLSTGILSRLVCALGPGRFAKPGSSSTTRPSLAGTRSPQDSWAWAQAVGASAEAIRGRVQRLRQSQKSADDEHAGSEWIEDRGRRAARQVLREAERLAAELAEDARAHLKPGERIELAGVEYVDDGYSSRGGREPLSPPTRFGRYGGPEAGGTGGEKPSNEDGRWRCVLPRWPVPEFWNWPSSVRCSASRPRSRPTRKRRFAPDAQRVRGLRGPCPRSGQGWLVGRLRRAQGRAFGYLLGTSCARSYRRFPLASAMGRGGFEPPTDGL